MEYLGNKLKNARELKKESYEDVSLKINVAVRYLKAMEEDDFSVFPGEVYAIGFLKSYGAYLGVNSDELISLYRAMKLQEQPTPVDQLLYKRRAFPVKIVIQILAAVTIIAAIAGGVYFALHLPKRTPAEPKIRATKEYIMNENPEERRLFLGDTFVVRYNETNYQFMLMNIGESLTIESPISDIHLDLGQEAMVDMDDDGFNELKIIATDFVKNHPDTGARLHFDLDVSSPRATVLEAAGTTTGAANSQTVPAIVIVSSPSPYPFTVQAAFQGFCLFRWEILAEQDRQGRNERYFERNDEFNIQAQNGVRVGASNAATVKIQVISGGRNVPVELGVAGEVVVAEIHWIRDETNRYQLVLSRLE
ncbi:MAG: helix-turn-helix domain-containing protein [Treponema sp.]|jgi:transcriptional regulator with XRE-family HTH domain|nr:helix-turn-helix domain-containing protein [Treponema sp.]